MMVFELDSSRYRCLGFSNSFFVSSVDLGKDVRTLKSMDFIRGLNISSRPRLAELE